MFLVAKVAVAARGNLRLNSLNLPHCVFHNEQISRSLFLNIQKSCLG
jgi:hypothetical protein